MKKLLIVVFLVFISGCALFQHHPSISVSPKPINQMWESVKKSDWLITVSIVGIAIGVFAFINGSKIGLPAIASCCVSLFMTLAVVRYATWMAICGLIGSVLACGVSILLRKKALVEIIKGAQHLKKEVSDIIGSETLKTYQSKPTQKLVQQIKTNLKLRGEL